MDRWTTLMLTNLWPKAIFCYFISIMSIILLAYALPMDIKEHEMMTTMATERAHKDVRVFSGIEVPPPEILRFMRRFGYLEGSTTDGNEDAETLYHESAIVEAIKNVQKYGALRQTGKLDNETLNLLNSPRCGMPDIEGHLWYARYYLASAATTTQPSIAILSKRRMRHRRYVIGARPWEKRRIRYFIANWSFKIPRSQIERDFARALQLWSRYSGLHFIRVNTTEADIIIGFGTGYHGDSYPFDGPGGVLAHAYYPYDRGSWGGDIHFDEDEHWLQNSRNLTDGVDFYAVAVHELGHSLGLAHSPLSTSIMFPYYKGPEQGLDWDDIKAMREIYLHRSLPDDGAIYREIFHPPITSTETAILEESTTKKFESTFEGDFESVKEHKERYGQVLTSNKDTPSFLKTSLSSPIENSTIPNICAGNFDAVTVIAGFVHIFKGSYIWKLTANYTIFTGYPIQLYQIFPFLKDEQIKHIDAIYERFDGALVLFSGSKFWISNPSENISKPITELLGHGNASIKINAAMVWPKNNLTYIFSNTKFWRFNDQLGQMDIGYPKSIRRWPGIPNSIDAAATLNNGKTYFFKRNLYWLYNNRFLRPENGYPRLIGPAWLKDYCNINQTAINLQMTNINLNFI